MMGKVCPSLKEVGLSSLKEVGLSSGVLPGFLRGRRAPSTFAGKATINLGSS